VEGHARPQAPQWASAVVRFTSQPVEALVSQSPKPVAQVTPQRPAVQVRVALEPVAQALPQAPQLSGSVCVEVHELPQRTWSAAQPEMHDGDGPAPEQSGRSVGHARPHPPQLDADSRDVSQPLAGSPSQSP
jgi:hypothetical protein